MKHINKKIIPLLFVCISTLLLSACESEESVFPWDGQWQRTVLVPKDVQGRCVDEKLAVHKKQWKLNVVIHATYECNQPFLELEYEGVIQEVKIRRNTDDRDLALQIFDIHLVAMFDIGKTGKAALSDSMIKTLSGKYIPKQYQHYEQKVYLSENADTMKSSVYQPVLNLAIPLYPQDATPADYRKVE